MNVCEAALGAGTRKIVFAGSGGTIYGVPESLPVKESHSQHPTSPYGVSKKAAVDYLYYYREIHGLEYTVLALANVYGPRQDPHGEAGVIAIFGGALLAGKQPTIYGDGKQTRDYVFVDDVVDAFVRATEKGGGLLMNIGTGVETSVVELFEVMARLTGFRDEARFAPERPGELLRSALDPGPRRDPPGVEALDVDRRRPDPHPRLAPRVPPRRASAVPPSSTPAARSAFSASVTPRTWTGLEPGRGGAVDVELVVVEEQDAVRSGPRAARRRGRRPRGRA